MSSIDRADVRAHVQNRGLPEPPSRADIDVTETVRAVADLGIDNAGETPVQNAVEDAVEPGRRIVFEPGEYRLSGELRITDTANFELVGEDGASFVLDSGLTTLVISYLGCQDAAFVNFTVDQSADDASAHTRFNCPDGIVVRDVEYAGWSDPDDSGKKLVPQATADGGSILVEGCVMTDGTEVGHPDVPHNDEHKQQYDGGMWAGPNHEGTTYVVDCRCGNWSDNGLYASRTNGGIVVAGGEYYNNSISNIRVSHEDSFVGGGVYSWVDPAAIPPENDPTGEGLSLTRCIWLECFPTSIPNAGAVVGDCHLKVRGGAVQAAIGVERTMGHVDVVGPCDIEITNGDRAIYARSPSTAPSPYRLHCEDVTVVGDDDGSVPLIDVDERPNSAVDGSCLHHDGNGRDGIRFQGDAGSVSNSTVNVDGTAVVNASTSNVSRSGSCELRHPDDGVGRNLDGYEYPRRRMRELLAVLRAARTSAR